MLSREDIKRETQPLCNQEREVAGVPLLHHPLYTNGIGYLRLLFDVRALDKEEIPYLGILKAVLGMVDTEHYGYGELFNEINMQTGGIATTLGIYPDYRESGKYRAFFEVKAKALYDKTDFVCSMLEEILFHSKLEDDKRLYEIIAQLKFPASDAHNLRWALHCGLVRSMAYFQRFRRLTT